MSGLHVTPNWVWICKSTFILNPDEHMVLPIVEFLEWAVHVRAGRNFLRRMVERLRLVSERGNGIGKKILVSGDFFCYYLDQCNEWRLHYAISIEGQKCNLRIRYAGR
jgi:hypothetical protein